jgi:uncharacterized protein YbjT (DUF2867 family)
LSRSHSLNAAPTGPSIDSVDGPSANVRQRGLVGISAVDIRDIAEAAAISLTSDKHFGRTYNLNGPAILSGPRVASIWSRLRGKEIKYAGDNLDIFEEQMRKHAPAWAAFDIRMMPRTMTLRY